MCSINHNKKAIFIHIPKTAGIYVRSLLRENYDFDLYLCQRPDHFEYCETNLNLEDLNRPPYFGNKLKGIIEYYKTSEYLNELMEMDEEKWNTYYKFCFVRNPYDRFVSGWNYIQETHKLNIDFDKYFEYENVLSEDEYFHTFLPQYKHTIDENGKMFIDKICKFENLENDLKEVLLKIGFTENEITHTNTKINDRAHKNYTEYYNNDLINIINEKFLKDFELFGYDKL
jgi:Sulfotransferase family